MDADPSRWRRVNELFHAAVAVAPADRDAFLSTQCGVDRALRAEVESLLLMHRDDDGRIAQRLRPGSRIGDYEITGFIDAGGMGDVYRARDTRLGRDAALKVLPAAVVSDPDRRARFEREARALAALTHPHIATIYGVEEADGVNALALELVDGETLADRIARGRLPVDETLRIARQIAEALETAHEHGIVHRDLKPANVKITRDGVVKVLDFGLAKLTDSADGRSLPGRSAVATLPNVTGVGTIVGTPAFMSPEQARGEPADQRTDIWAFGCILYEMLTGQSAFAANTVADTIARVLASEPRLEAVPKGVPETIRTLLTRCLAKDRVQRIPHVSVIRYLLDESNAPKRDESWRAWTLQLLQNRNSRVVVIVAIVFLIPALRVVVRAIFPSRPTVPQSASGTVGGTPLRSDILSPSDAPFVSTSIELSPNGRWLAFETNETLRVRDLASGETRTLTDIQVTGRRLFWSPDSRTVAFFDDGKLQTVEIGAGSKPRTVFNDAPTADGGTWNSTGTILFTGATGQASAVMRVDIDGSDMKPVTTLAVDRGETAHLWPSFLSDGNHFLYFALNRDPARNALYLATLNGSTPIRISGIDGEARYAESGFLVYARGGSLIARRFDDTNGALSGDEISLATDGLFNSRDGSAAFSVSRTGMLVYVPGTDNGQRVLTWFDRVGNRIGSVGEPADYSNFRLSPDAKRIAEDRGRIRDRHLWIRDIDRGTSTRLTFGDLVEKAPAWSPDGSRVLFTKDGDETEDGDSLYVVPADGSRPERLLVRYKKQQSPSGSRLTSVGRSSDWSPDGKWIVAEVGFPSSDLFLFDVNGGSARPFVNTRFSEGYPRFSPDGNWIAYTSDESGSVEVYVRPFPGPGAKIQVSPRGGHWPRWRRDGREIFYISDDRRVMSTSFSSPPTPRVGVPAELFQTQIVNAMTNGLVDPFDVSPDGQRFLLMERAVDNASSIRAIVNWPALVDR